MVLRCVACGGLMDTGEARQGDFLTCPHCGQSCEVPTEDFPVTEPGPPPLPRREDAYISFYCLSCNAPLDCLRKEFGKTFVCPACGNTIHGQRGRAWSIRLTGQPGRPTPILDGMERLAENLSKAGKQTSAVGCSMMSLGCALPFVLLAVIFLWLLFFR